MSLSGCFSDGSVHAYDLSELSVEANEISDRFSGLIHQISCAMIDHNAAGTVCSPFADDLGSTRFCAAGQDQWLRLLGIHEFERRLELHVGGPPVGRCPV